MIRTDLHMHTRHSHGRDSAEAMYAAARDAGMEVVGFSEHSPRPRGYDYAHEYRDRLEAGLPDYVREVRDLQERSRAEGGPLVLFGMEMDWLDGAEDFVRAACAAHDFDYLIGSVHFIGTWGFDEAMETWSAFSREEREERYDAYFAAWRRMIASGLFQIAAHPDIVKIFSADSFHEWLGAPRARDLLAGALEELRDAGMAMEISSAGLRKPCREIYPAPPFMLLARRLNLPVSFASDAHVSEDVAHGFPRLETYARAFGFTEGVSFRRGVMTRHPL